ncbi:Putative Zn-dependent protease, contains TPR repeats [Lishizhenia tianjinensis]|uniref:Putative Zn-dependent protease, contains TPR repeats n=1 Tax=Lishizhenia tianjinensis TaxID=477690 RepID=A0A1I7BUV9_9FLAO|nr:M48 family metallopeptidase [Lishizhenia tianjinensis]SFT90957.1 Putative Zn-dependent protease, contains TPR repeats [Lishizhenia tianjinensis]
MKYLSLCLSLLSVFFLQAQIDFNNYEKVKSKGEIPESFKLTLDERYNQDLKVDYGLSGYEQKEYVFMKATSLDNLIQSGLVVYGDDMTKYIEDLAKKLLKDDEYIFDELSFFTLRSNVANAFITGDGMVFVTMGLLSQLVSESDLAFVLSHEIAHYEEKHVLNSFKRRKELERANIELEIEDFSTYSKQHETEADSLGLIRYLEAGYSIDQIEQVFDILMYSHLPIDEVSVSKEFLVGDLAHIPEEYLMLEEKAIDYTEDYDDTKSSHPNIKSRKQFALKLYKQELSKFKGTQQYLLGEDRFNQIRSIARFERVQNWLYSRDYANCLYEIAILEKQYPNNKHLMRSKALAWTNAAVYAVEGSNKDVFTDPDDLEGKIAGVNYFFDQLTDDDFVVYALRNVLNLKEHFPNDKMFEKMENTLLHLMLLEDLDLTKFYAKSLTQTAQELEALKTKRDTSLVEQKETDKNKYGYTQEEWEKLSKYDKIKIKKSFVDDGVITASDKIDSSEYLLYALSDIARDEKYLELFSTYKEAFKAKEELQDSINELNPRQYVAYLEAQPTLDLSEEKLIFVEPVAVRKNFGVVQYNKTLKLSEKMHEVYDEYPYVHGKQNAIVNLNKHNLAEVGTEGYNARAALERYFYRYLDLGSSYYVNPDMEEFEQISKEYNSDYFVFSLLLDDKKLTLDPNYVYLSFYTLFIILPPHIAVELTKMHKVRYDVVVFDLHSGDVVKQSSYSFNARPSKTILSLYLNDILNN